MRCRPGRTSRQSPDDGFSLLLVIGTGAVAMALMLVAGTIAVRSLTSSRDHAHFEGALASAENGVDAMLARALKLYNSAGTDSYVTPSTGIPGDPTPDCSAPTVTWPFATQPDRATERSWAAARLRSLATTSGCLRRSPTGDYVLLKPAGHQAVYAMGWFPHYGVTGAKARLLKAEYLFAPYKPSHAILTAGDLELGSSTVVTSAPPADPALAAVHSNGRVTVASGNPTVYGVVSSTGSSTASSNKFMANAGGSVTRTAKVALPEVSALTIWRREHAGDHSGGWYDLCADGTVRAADGSAPCQGTLTTDLSGGGSFRGWTFDGSTTVPRWTATAALMQNGYSGTYYVDGGDAIGAGSSSGAAVPNVTVIAAASTTTCAKVGGNISWDHIDIAAPSVPNLFLLADQDLLTTSNFTAGSAVAGTVISGFFIAGDQVQMETSSSGAYGAVVAADQCAPASSLVASNYVKNPAIYYDPNAQAPFSMVIDTTQWLELVGG